jgi:hypothetical protein
MQNTQEKELKGRKAYFRIGFSPWLADCNALGLR